MKYAVCAFILVIFATLLKSESIAQEQQISVDDIIGQLTLEEKVKLCHGTVTEFRPLRFVSGGINRLEIGELETLDGPVGVRLFGQDDYQTDVLLKSNHTNIIEGVHISPEDEYATALPSTLSLSCTWDKNAARRYANVLAEEMLFLQKHVLFGPGLNMMRSPLGGRNFEYMGEDPYLTGVIGVNYIDALQGKGVAACAKHYIANEADQYRHFSSSNLDERTLHEVYLLPFEMAVKQANVWTIMTANSLINGKHCSESSDLVQQILKNQIGFDGVVLTDWRAAYTAKGSALAGTDITTGYCAYVFGDTEIGLLPEVEKGEVPMSVLDDKVKRILTLYERVGLLDLNVAKKRETGAINSAESKKEARKLASEGMVLLKNENKLLPLNRDNISRIIVTGPSAEKVPAGTGSSLVKSEFRVTPLQGIQNALGSLKLEYYKYSPDVDVSIEKVKSSDVIIFFAESHQSGENGDLPDMKLPDEQDEVIAKLASLNCKIVVVPIACGPVDMSAWNEDVNAILYCLYSGQSTGDAVADILFGETNPSGKLSFTLAKDLNDYACHSLDLWPVKPICNEAPTSAPYLKEYRKPVHAYNWDYLEGIFTGYRWFDKHKTEPLYPFGFGLSYSDFSISDSGIKIISSNKANPEVYVAVKVSNTGDRDGKEVIQLYVEELEPELVRPKLELKAFEKCFVPRGKSEIVILKLDKASFSYWDVLTSAWKIKPGTFRIHVGNSSRDIKYTKDVSIE